MPTVEAKQAEQNPAAEEKEDLKSLETRFGLVMYGGVSLAIYINGVAREFFRAVRGAGVYKLIKALTDRDVVVDVISGTSAGGINGIMLAYALCNQKDFASCASLWRLDGDVRSLLRSPYRDADTSESLFDSEGYYQPRLEAAFREMPDYVEEEGEVNSTFPELDLFVTGTDVDGRISTQFDDAGHPIDVKDHRSVFHLKHRRGRKHPFEPGFAPDGQSPPEATYRALAKLARITSCFPAAFTPVHVSGSEPAGYATQDGKLRLWGKLEKESCFLDGGVIDNKPFTYTIREIFNRSADRDVERKLFYVEPDPEHFKQPEVASRPNFVQAVIASLIGIPGYESIADDLRLLAKHNSKVKQYGRLRRYLEERAVARLRAEKEADTALASGAAVALKAEGAAAKDGAPRAPLKEDKALYEQCSLISISERVVEGLLKVDGKSELLSRRDRELAAALIQAFDDVQEKIRQITFHDRDVRDNVPTFLRNFDVYFRQRRLQRTVYKLVEVLRAALKRNAEVAVARYTKLWRVLNRELELLEIVRTNMEQLIDDAPVSWKKEIGGALSGNSNEERLKREGTVVWDIITEALYRLLDRAPERSGDPAELQPPPGERLPDAFRQVYNQIKAFEGKSDAEVSGFDSDTLTSLNRYLRERRAKIIRQIDADEIRKAVEKLTDRQRAQQSRDFTGILQLTREFERNVIGRMMNPERGEEPETAREMEEVRATYFQFQRLDEQMFPIEFVAELYEKDVIETIRISPLDAGRGFSNKGLSDKVSGDALYHFAGFFKRSWRANDILWGRLDSLCQLTEVLLNERRIKEVIENRTLLNNVRKRFFKNSDQAGRKPDEAGAAEPLWVEEMHPERLFPHAGEATQTVLAQWLKDLLWWDKPKFDPDDFNKTKIARVIEAAQLEVLFEDLPGVISDSLAEQARWNQFRYPPGAKAKPGAKAGAGANGGRPAAAEEEEETDPAKYWPVYGYSPGALDPYVTVLAAAGRAHDAMRRFELQSAREKPDTPMKTGLGKYFVNQYSIGSEALLRDMPALVLMEILSVSLLVVRNCLLKVFGSQAERIRSQPLYIFGVDLPLRAFHTMVVFMRRVPGSRKWLPKTLGLISIPLLGIGVIWWKPIVWSEAGLHAHWFALFVGGPLVVLAAWLIYLYEGKVGQWGLLRGALLLALGVMFIWPFVIIVLAYQATHGAAAEAVQGIYHGWFELVVRAWPPFSWLAGRGLAGALAGYTVGALVVTPFVFPLAALLLIGRLKRPGRPSPERLRTLLENHFTIPEMLAVASRLDLFDDKHVHKLAAELGVFDKDDDRLGQIAERNDWRKKIEKRHEELLNIFKAELARKLGVTHLPIKFITGPRLWGVRRTAPQYQELISNLRAKLGSKDSEEFAKAVAAESRKVRYRAIIDIYNEVENERKREAYDRLAERLAQIDAEHRAAVEARLPRAGALAEEKKAEAVNALLAEVRRVEALKAKLGREAIENAQETDQAVDAGFRLAAELVAAAQAADERPNVFKRVGSRLSARRKEPPAPAKKRRLKKRGEPEKMMTRLENVMYLINPGAMS